MQTDLVERRRSDRRGGGRLAAAVALITIGCSSYQPLAMPVSGVVTVDGQPEPGVWVSFIPTDRDKHIEGFLGIDDTDESGRFVIKNLDGEETFFSGEFKVTFVRFLKQDGSLIRPGEKPSDVGAENVLPERYMTPFLTPFTVEVTRENTEFSFELTTTPDDALPDVDDPSSGS